MTSTGIGWDTLATMERGQQMEDPSSHLAEPLARPITVAWLRPDPVSVLGVALALGHHRRGMTAVVDQDGTVARLAGANPISIEQMIAAQAMLRADPRPVALPVPHMTCGVGGASLLWAHSVMTRPGGPLESVLLGWDDPVCLGVADVWIHPVRWTTASVSDTATRLDNLHKAGENLGRVVLVAHEHPADPGMETRARRWFGGFPICTVPSDPAASVPDVTWDRLRPTTRAALAALAGTIIGLANRQATTPKKGTK